MFSRPFSQEETHITKTYHFRRTVLWGLLAILSLAVEGKSVDWYDNFDDGDPLDGDPVTWVQFVECPGTYTAPNGDFEMHPTDPGSGERCAAAHVENIIFEGSVSIRAQAKSFGPGDVGVLAHFDVNILTGYLVKIGWLGNLRIWRLDNGQLILLAERTLWNMSPDTDVLIQLDIIPGEQPGEQQTLRAWAWRPSVESRPTRPQLTWFDNLYTEGTAGLWFNTDAAGAYGIFRFAQASESLFPDQCHYDLVGDVNNDCTVNLLDFAMLAANYLIDCNLDPSGPYEPPCVLK